MKFVAIEAALLGLTYPIAFKYVPDATLIYKKRHRLTGFCSFKDLSHRFGYRHGLTIQYPYSLTAIACSGNNRGIRAGRESAAIAISYPHGQLFPKQTMLAVYVVFSKFL
jgi:hypothetical protein